ncbi:MAG TPA: hypothetical protein PLO59_07860, partial [Bacteroidia bacterium]|nr:hypothetical protein [Bacteroidia bacterium]
SKDAFDMFRAVLQQLEQQYREAVLKLDSRIAISYDDKGKLEVHFQAANDVLVFIMQTHVFNFDPSHSIHRSSYTKDDPLRSHCGMICIYNFLTDSLKYKRLSDNGIMIGRVFINKDGHYFVEGKKQLGILFNNFETEEITLDAVAKIINSAMSYALESDANVPGFDMMQVTNLQALSERSGIGFDSGKSFGFQMMHNENK